jgi:putative transposase
VDCAVTLKRIYVFFVLEVGNRFMHLLGATTNPDVLWITQQVRNLVMDLGDRVTEFRFLVRDRAGQCVASFDAVLADVGIRVAGFLLAVGGRTVSPKGSYAPSEPNSPTVS